MKLVLEHNRDFSGGPGVETLHFQGRGLWVQALVRELGCQDPHGGAKKYIFFKRLEHVTERHTSLKNKRGQRKVQFRHMVRAQSHLILCNFKHCSPPGSFVHGISQARILEWVAISSSRDSS